MYGYLSHNYEAMGVKRIKIDDEYQNGDAGKVTGQFFSPAYFCTTTFRKYYENDYDKFKIEEKGPYLLLPGLMLQETNVNSLSNAMWRVSTFRENESSSH